MENAVRGVGVADADVRCILHAFIKLRFYTFEIGYFVRFLRLIIEPRPSFLAECPVTAHRAI